MLVARDKTKLLAVKKQLEALAPVKVPVIPRDLSLPDAAAQVMVKGKVVAVHGMVNKLMTLSLRTAPRWLPPAIVRWLHKPASGRLS